MVLGETAKSFALAPDGRTVFLMIEGDPETIGDVISINDIDANVP